MIIDTNIYSALDRAESTTLKMMANVPIAYLPIIVLGELQYGFMKGSREDENINRLKRFLSQDTVEVLNIKAETTRYYGELSLLCKKSGRALSNNDIWIAALAMENDLPLATFDKDFAVFKDILKSGLILL